MTPDDRDTGRSGAGAAADVRRMEEWIVGRLAELESRDRKLRRKVTVLTVLLILATGLAAVALYLSPAMPFGPPVSALTASSFVLQDGAGNVRGEWTVREDDGAARLTLNDRAETERLRMTVLGGGAPGMVFADDAGNNRIVLGLLPDETTTLVFADDQGYSRAVLGVATDQSANLVFADRSGRMRAALGTDQRGRPTFLLPEPDEVAPELPSELLPGDTTSLEPGG